ncbi:metal ABC transporter ATP-binding protein [Bacillus mycoides]|uniref:metal ABC transporter ATP-binding protein n=1 Tax=Bacillus mycoides TaxID=1405 RepID=UPI0035CBB127
MKLENPPILTINSLSIIYENSHGITDINLEFQPGDFVALVGSNGAGKSTLMNGISGIQEITKGTISFHDNYINKNNPFSILGFSPQNQVIDWYLNVIDNVLLGPLLAGIGRKQSKQMALDALRQVNLENKNSFSVDQLSGGQQQRVQIARAIAHKPIFYLLDEPTTGLDAESAEIFLQYLNSRVNESTCSVLISSHDLNLLERYCNKMIYIEEGKIIYHGSISEFLNNNNQVNKYVIEYQGTLDTTTLDKITALGAEILSTKPLILNVNQALSISNIISILEKTTKIINIKNERNSLRETYLKLKTTKER